NRHRKPDFRDFVKCRYRIKKIGKYYYLFTSLTVSRHRFCTMSGEHLCTDIVSVPCRENTSAPTSFLRHVGSTPLPRHRFCAMSGEHLYPDIVSAPSRENTQQHGIASIRCRVMSNF